MTRSVFIASSERQVSKSVIALGVVELFNRQVRTVGVFRPLVESTTSDGVAHALLDLNSVSRQTFDEAVGVTHAEFADDPDAAIDKIVAKYSTLAARCDAVVVVGSDYSGFYSSTELDHNAVIAANLNAPVFYVCGATDRTPEQVRGIVQETIEAFEESVLHKIRARGVTGSLVYLLEASGAAADLVARHGAAAASYASQMTDAGLAALADRVDGISVDKKLILRADAAGNTLGLSTLVDRAHAAGLTVFCWTLRAENRFLGKNLRRGAAAGDFGDWLGEFRLVMASGVDGVFADQPDLALEARARL